MRLRGIPEPVTEQNQLGRHALFPDTGVDGRDQGGTALDLHLGGTMSEDHNGQVSGCREFLEAADNVLKHLEPPL